jgi:hypothetical protein
MVDRVHSPGGPTAPRGWDELDESERTRLQVDYGYELDRLPPTCSLETKIQRFRRWLAARGIDYRG